MTSNKITKICLFILILISTVGSYFTHVALNLYQSRQDFILAELVNAQSSAIERRLSRSLSSTRILAQEVRQQGGLFSSFEDYAEEIIQTVGGISNLQLAPDGVVQAIHPLAGNEKALGHDILKDDQRRKEALMALKERQMTLAGPFKLIQGGIAIIGRNPVYVRDTTLGKERFWGFASALIFLDDLISVTDLLDLESKGYTFELSRTHPDTGDKISFAASKNPIDDHGIEVKIKVPNGEWFLNISGPNHVPLGAYWIGYFLSVSIAFLIAALLRKILLHPQLLEVEVDIKTRELQYQAHHDALTNLSNRENLKENVEHALADYRRSGAKAALLIIDLDDFKPINDLSGHEVGDNVLKQVAHRIKKCTREVDTVARIGGDEFAILLERVDSVPSVTRCIDCILADVRKPYFVGDQSYTVSASVGIATLPHDGNSFTDLYKNADIAMYAAKDSGKNNFVFYDSSLQIEAVNRISTLQELVKGLEHNELELYFQPIVAINNQTIVGYEALMRWNHPEKGLVTPDNFIGIAENSKVIFELGYWAFNETCRLISLELINTRVSVNLSPKQFRDPNLFDRLSRAISDYKIDPALIELELTESCFIDDIEGAVDTMNNLLRVGLSISLDDFGTGYSSLTLLRRLPVQKLKIDRSFVNDMIIDERDNDIVNGMISMAHNLGLEVVAEGIETKAQLSRLQEMRCDLGQGYYFGKPKPVCAGTE